MTLVSATRLGPYEIVAPLGVGGMGEVYRARDTRLGRDVAIKVLPADVAADPERLRRFRQEALAVSALNHVNILTVHDVGSEGGTNYLVTELLVGQSLRELLREGPLPPRRALEIGVQVARGLAAAHDKDIVHRDLKPENLYLTRDGGAKILDFGLARMDRPECTGDHAQSASTVVNTTAGTVMGTVGYMAPEQVRGQHTDARTDLFAFGVVLYEMLAGTNPFRRDTAVESMSAILKEDVPDIGELAGHAPTAFGGIVARLLAKDPERRFRSAADLAFVLETLMGTPTGSTASLPALQHGTLVWSRRALAVAAAGALALAVGAWWLGRSSIEPTPAAPPLRFDFGAPDGTTLYSFSGPTVISPDGRHVALVVHSEGRYMLAVRSLDGTAARLIPLTDGASFPFWSPDSRSLAFTAKNKLRAVDIAGGAPHDIADAPGAVTGAWARDNSFVIGGFGAGLQRIAGDGGRPQQITSLDEQRAEIGHLWPVILPDGNHVVYLARSAQPALSRVVVTTLDGATSTTLLSEDTNVAYASSGYLLYVSGGRLLAQPFDAERVAFAGDPYEIAPAVFRFNATSGALFSVSDNGVLVLATAGNHESQLAWFDRDGRELGTVGPLAEHLQVDLAPDGRSVIDEVVDPATANGTLWRHDLTRNVSSRFQLDAEWYWGPRWSPDGRWIAFARGDTVVVRAADGGEAGSTVAAEPGRILSPTGWSADGQSLVVAASGGGSQDLLLLPWQGQEKAQPLLVSEFDEMQGSPSAGGRWLAYASNESGRMEVYVRPFPSGDRKWQISGAGGSQPLWRRDGRELFYLDASRRLMSVEIGAGPEFTATPPRLLFATRARRFFDRFDYAVSSDGQRFLVNTRLENGSESRIHVIVNWPQLLLPSPIAAMRTPGPLASALRPN